MTTAEIAAPKRNGLAVLWDLIIAPSAAFGELKRVPHWGWALVVTCVLGMVGAFVQAPAAEHVSAYLVAHDPRFATMPAEQAASAKNVSIMIQRYAWVFFPLIVVIAVAFSALILLVANAIGRGSGNFMMFFALSANVAFLNFGLGYLLHAVIVSARGAENFQTANDLLAVVPNLAWIVPGAGAKLVAFLTTFNVFEIWSIVLLALGVRSITGISAAIAWTTPIALAVLGGLLATLNAH
jgi:hypothetical protein